MRAYKALEIAASADRWLRVGVADGQVAYAIPSQFKPGLGYVVDVDTCTCRDFELRQEPCKHVLAVRRQEPCKHVLAVRLHLEHLSGEGGRSIPSVSTATPQPCNQRSAAPRQYTPEQLAEASAVYDKLFPVEG